MNKVTLFTFVIVITSFLLPAYASSTKIYVWHNEAGVLVFSDTPRPGAEEVEVKENNTVISAVDTSVLDITPKVIEEKYQVEIIQPKNNATIRDNTGSMYIAGRVKPIFKQGLTVQLYLDGKPYEQPQIHSMFSLRYIERGEHQIKMEILNDKGKLIASSEPITFYMHRATVN